VSKAWAADLRRTRHIVDFSRWKDHDSYQKAFERLLGDLEAEGEAHYCSIKGRKANVRHGVPRSDAAPIPVT